MIRQWMTCQAHDAPSPLSGRQLSQYFPFRFCYEHCATIVSNHRPWTIGSSGTLRVTFDVLLVGSGFSHYYCSTEKDRKCSVHSDHRFFWAGGPHMIVQLDPWRSCQMLQKTSPFHSAYRCWTSSWLSQKYVLLTNWKTRLSLWHMPLSM